MHIAKQVLSEITVPKLILHEIKEPKFRNKFIKQFLTSKTTKHITPEQKDQFFSDKLEGALFPSYKEYFDKLKKKDAPSGNYTNITDAYDVSEYFTGVERFKVTPDYLKHIKSGKNGFIVNVYSEEMSKDPIRANIWEDSDENRKKLRFSEGKIPQYEICSPKEVKYSIVGQQMYTYNVYIESCLNPVPVLLIDLPYSYFSTQNTPAHIFTWDLDKEKYQIGGKDIKNINSVINEVAKNGIKEPLVFRISKGRLYPADNDVAIMMFLATYLNLPSIPVALYMSNDNAVRNQFMEELVESAFSKDLDSEDFISSINLITSPYFIFEKAIDNESKGFLTVGTKDFHKTQYPSITDINDKTALVLDRYLDPNITAPKIERGMSEKDCEEMIAEVHAKMKKELDEKIKQEHGEVVKKILAGAYDK